MFWCCNLVWWIAGLKLVDGHKELKKYFAHKLSDGFTIDWYNLILIRWLIYLDTLTFPEVNQVIGEIIQDTRCVPSGLKRKEWDQSGF